MSIYTSKLHHKYHKKVSVPLIWDLGVTYYFCRFKLGSVICSMMNNVAA